MEFRLSEILLATSFGTPSHPTSGAESRVLVLYCANILTHRPTESNELKYQ